MLKAMSKCYSQHAKKLFEKRTVLQVLKEKELAKNTKPRDDLKPDSDVENKASNKKKEYRLGANCSSISNTDIPSNPILKGHSTGNKEALVSLKNLIENMFVLGYKLNLEQVKSSEYSMIIEKALLRVFPDASYTARLLLEWIFDNEKSVNFTFNTQILRNIYHFICEEFSNEFGPVTANKIKSRAIHATKKDDIRHVLRLKLVLKEGY